MSEFQQEHDAISPLAIIGMSCRYPGGIYSPEDLWQVVADEREVIGDFPEDRGWDVESLYDPDPDSPGKTYVKRGGFLAGAADFDPAFFGISPREALSMDPQQRLLLEAAWEVLERAAIDPAAVKGTRTGVFIGAEPREYGPRLYAAPDGLEGYLLTGTTTSVMSGRIAYSLGLHGPAVTVDTSASSSLVAIHLAAQSLLRGECSLAIAGGVSVMATPGNFVAYSGLRVLSPAGRCQPFSAAADGTVWSEGVGLIVLEPLSAALRNGHQVMALVRGSAVSSDGKSNSLTAPNRMAQHMAIRDALATAGLAPDDVDAVEAHGTGTPLGDRVEVQALIDTYGQGRRAERPLLVGSVKSNIGHTLAAAGVAGVIKMVMALRHGVLPRSLHLDEPMTQVDWPAAGVSLLTEAAPWPGTGRARRAGVSSFGISGTNAHAILEQAPDPDDKAGAAAGGTRPLVTSGVVPWVVSGRSAEGAAAQGRRLAAFTAARPGLSPVDVAWSLATTRSVFEHRAVVLGADAGELTTGLEAVAAGQPSPGVVAGVAGGPGQVGFVFAGQGSQRAGMGRELHAASPVFAAAFDAACALLEAELGLPVAEVVLSAGADERADQTVFAQAGLFAVQAGLVALLAAAGIRPSAVAGHSVGEIAAAYAAGVLSLEDACALVAARGRLMQALPSGGAMTAVEASEEDVTAALAGVAGVSVAAVNGPSSVVVSGDAAAVGRVTEGFRAAGRRVKALRVSHAFHSARMDPVLDELGRVAAGLAHRAPRVPWAHGVSGDLAVEPVPGYWPAQARQPVRFADAVTALAAEGVTVFVEIGPDGTLSAMGPGALGAAGGDAAAFVPVLRPGQDAARAVLSALAGLFVRGVAVDWPAVLGAGRRVELPTYAFQRQRYWLASGGAGDATGLSASRSAAVAVPAAGSGRLAARLAALPPAERDEVARHIVLSQAAAVLGLPPMEDDAADRSFRELGFDSLSGVELRDRLNTASGLRLPPSVIFDYPTPDALAAHVLAGLLGETAGRAERAAGTGAMAPGAGDDRLVIVGTGCRFPGGVGSAEDLWELVASGGEGLSEFPTDRGWADDVFDPERGAAGKSYTGVGGFLAGAGDFDAAFFGISPREALTMDPQQRLLLETSWEALEDAGIDPESLRGSATGVFAGLMYHDYAADAADAEGYRVGSGAVVSGRVSYTLGLEGPAVTVDTACSSSLVALHLAVQALRSGECSLALAGGVTVMATPATFVDFSRQGGLAADGRCKPYADAADGTGWSEGVGVLVLERLADARRLGHRVLAVVAGSAVNQDGASNGLTAPNGPSQQRVIRAALASAGLSAPDVDVIEGHGTGTRLGDPIEAQALLATYGQGRDETRPVLLGSVKSNIGHTQAAAGVAGVIKMIQAMARGTVPATLHVDAPSSRVDWDAGAVQVVTEATSWPDTGRPRRAAVSSFGISGTNAHIVLEQAPDLDDGDDIAAEPGLAGPTAAEPPVARPVVWPVSGRSAEGLQTQAMRLAQWVAARPGLEPTDAGWSLATTRSAFAHRGVVVGRNREELTAALGELAAGEDGAGVVRGVASAAGKVAVVFTGQGSQRAGMGAGLYQAYPVFAEAFDAVCAVLDGHLGGPVAEVIAGRIPGLDETVWTQAGLFAVEAALFALLRSWGITPEVVGGYSVGELAAAYAAGVWSLEDACAMVAARGRLMQALPAGGAMAAIAAGEAEVEAELAGYPGVVISAVNGPASVVISGDGTGVEQAAAAFAGRRVRTRRLRVSHAFHSPLMDPMLEEFAAVARSVAYREPELAVVSALTGRPVTAQEITDPGYWVRHVREPVRFSDAVAALRAAGVRTFIEAGPDGVLSGMGPATGPETAEHEAWLPVLRRGHDEPRAAVTAAAAAWVCGVPVGWPAVLGTGRRVDLPTYAFQRRRYWLLGGGAADAAGLGLETAGHPLLGAAVQLPATGGLVLTGRVSSAAQPWLADHVIAGRVLVPGTALAELAVRAADATGGGRVEELVIEAPLTVPARGGTAVQVMAGPPGEDGRREVAVYSRPDGGAAWVRHAAGMLAGAAGDGTPNAGDVQWPPAGAAPVNLAGFYPALAQAGYEYGPAFRGLRSAWQRGEELFAEVVLAEGTSPAEFAVHPALLDAALHALIARSAERGGPLLVPFAFIGVTVAAVGAASARVRIAPAGPEAVSVTLADAAGQPIASVAQLTLRPLPAGSAVAADALFQIDWIPARAGQREAGQEGAGSGAGDQRGLVVLGDDAGLDVPGAAGYPDVAVLADAVRGTAVGGLAVWCARPGDGNPAVAGRELAGRVLGLVQGWLAEPALAGWRLVVVTERAVDAGPEAGLVPAGSPVWGLVRSASAENPGRLVLGDVDVLAGAGELVVAGAGLGEPEFAVRGGQLRVPRLARARAGLAVPSAAGWRLGFSARGTVENLRLAEASEGLVPLGPGQVRVAVKAAGVNFRDVLNVLGMYPGDAGLPGLEGAGVVLETGPGVTGVAAGDAVMGLFSGAFGPVAVTDARLLVPVPAGWSLVQAAGAPVVFLTAWHALVTLAGLQPGERLLVHAAAGGVGMAAVQLARHLGAEVFGTASPPKHPVLASLGLDESHRASSRTTSFEQEFRAATGGTGVDVVLDSLAGEFVDASLRLTVPGGRFIEMGKTDVRDPAQVQAASGVSYQAFDLLADAGPDQVAGMLAELGALFASGVLVPLPAACWDVRQAAEAFRFLAQARHTGKVVLTIPAPARDGSALVTGASGALGKLVARHLAASGTPQLILASRSGPVATGTAALAAQLAASGAGVRAVACDVADRGSLANLITQIPAETPLRAVVHAAGVLDDGVTGSLTPARVDAVMRPKADAAWHLHELTARLDLDAFVLFSSVIGVWGGPGQGNYAAGNTFLDALAGYRSRLGLPALSLAWGSWEQGMAGRLAEADRRRLAGQGLRPLSDAEGLALLDAAAGVGRPLLVPARLELAARRELPPLLSSLAGPASLPERRVAGQVSDGAGTGGGLAARLAALPPADRDATVRSLVLAQAAAVLDTPRLEDPDAARSFRELGFDSLTAVELRNRLNAATELRLPPAVVFDYPTPYALAAHVRAQLLDEADGAAGAVAGVVTGADQDQVVIVGTGCRFAGGVGSAEDLWELVASGGVGLSEFPADRGWAEDVFDPERGAAGKSYAGVGGFLGGAGDFDAGFFGISPREALVMDPQQRLLLETSWEALEDAGIDPGSLRGSATGVFAGLIYHDYAAAGVGAVPSDAEGYLLTGGSGGVASGRVSYVLGLEGPAVTVDTACSSSLVALHLAVQALRSGECSLALAGGVTVMATPATFVDFSRQGGLAGDGRCKAFAEGADGTGWGEGVGVLVLERLGDARRLGHRVLAVVAGSAVNQDGASNGLTAPNGPSQQRVIRAALASAGLGPGDVDVVEGHGTGTRLGDPIEAQALLATYGQGRDEGRPLLLGSVKSNIGHTQAAAGVAGVIKMVAAIARGTVPPTLHVDAPSTRVDWDAGAVQVVTQSTPWPDAGRPRRAGVSSFGFSGTNAHVILEQPPAGDNAEGETVPAGSAEDGGAAQSALLPQAAGSALGGGDVVSAGSVAENSDGRPAVWVVSGRSADGLAAQAGRLAAWAAARAGLDAADVGWSLATTRPPLEHRAAAVGGSAAEPTAALADLAAGTDAPGLVRGVAGSAGKTAVVFTGQGAQRPGMGAGLYRAYPVFAEAFDAVCAVLDQHLGGPEGTVADVVAGRVPGLDETCWTQAGLFAVEAALFALLRSWGITPDAVAGYSVGELAAAYAAGVWSLEDACTLVAARGRLMQALPAGGAMTAVAAPEEEVLEVLAAFPGVVVSAVNGPSSVVISGDATGVEQAAQHFAGRGVRTRVLRVSHAFHSPLMDPMLEEFAAVARSVAYREPELMLVSALTGQPLTAGEVTDPGYWVAHVREPVRFADAVGALRSAGVRTFIEAGPDGILSGIGPAAGDPEQDEAWLPVLRRDRDEPRTAVTAVAGAWARGVTVDWPVVLGGGRRVSLPPRAFHHRRYWLSATPAADATGLGLDAPGHPLLGAAVELPAAGSLVLGSAAESAAGGLVLTGRLSRRAQPWLADHVIGGRVLVPGTALAEMAVRAAAAAGCACVEELLIEAPLVLPPRGGIAVQVMVGAAEDDGQREVAIYSRAGSGGSWVRHATGMLAAQLAGQPDVGWERQWPPAGAVPVDLEGFYPGLAEAGYEYGPSFRGLRAAWRRGEEVFAEVALAEDTAPGGFAVHPVLLDSALHVLAAGTADSGGKVLVPFAFTGLAVHAEGAAAVRVKIAQAGAERISVTLADAAGEPVASVAGLALRPLSVSTAAAEEALFRVEWTLARTGPAAGGQACGLVAVVGEDAGLAVPGAVSYPDVAALADAVRAGEAAVGGLAVWCARPGDGNPAVAGRVLAARVLEVVQGWLAEPALAGWRLVIVTGRAVDAGPEAGVDPAAAPVWGLVRSASAENPGRLVLGDVDVLAGSGELVIAGAGLGEPEFAVRGGQLRVPRLARARAGLAVPSAAGWRLAVGTAGTVEGLVLQEAAGGLARLGAGQVRVAVKAAGVNFRDVLNVLGMYPGDAGLPGLEGAGVVLETGPGVTGLEAGDMVMGLFSGAFGPVAVTDARLLARVPAGWSLVQAAGAPVVFLTAWHALVTLAGLQPGERLLVHAAAGGVGMAAVQLARHLGAEVFGTASPPKHPVLASLGLDESHRASSRTTSFEQEFRAATGGTGVDVVLDSLAGEFVDASLRLTVPGGRFIEMGKTDVRDPAQVQAASGVSYQAFDLLADAGPDQVAGMLAELGALFASGVLVPLPAACWDVRQAPEAFRFLAQARHAGKVVLTIPAPAREGSVLVTGASGSLGGLVAGHLAATGTQRLLLASRSGPAATGTAALAARLAGVGAAVQVSACDVADRRQLAGVIAGVPAETPLRGVVHAAGVLDDGVTGSLTAGRVDAVMRPKADGAWYLHELTTGMDLDSFVLFSSVAGVLGSAGQGNYAAGNMFLDALAAYRSRLGLPALSLAWGSWEQGMAGRLTEADRRRLAGQGIRPLADAEGLALLDAAVGAGRPALVPAGLDPAAWRGREGLLPLLSGLATLTTRRYALATAAAAGVAAAAGHGSLAARLAALPPAEQKTALRQVICTQAAAVLGMAALDEADAVRSFRELGFDSLTAVELRNRLAAVTGLRLPATLVFDYPTPDALASHVLAGLLGEADSATGPAGGAAVASADADEDQIVIVGMGCRFAGGVGSAEDLWELVASGGEGLSEFPVDRGWAEDVFDPERGAAGKSYAGVGGFLGGAGDFDAGFFGISPREALVMDPQQRLLLETSWEALEDAGIDPGSLRGSATGVFAGLIYHDYAAAGVGAVPSDAEGYLLTGGSGGVASGRVSYVLGLEGPAVTVDTACSSSLVALHLAVQALRSGECSLALAGGVTVMATPATFVDFSRQGGLAGDGRCKAFAEGADGTGWGEGVGVLVLERLGDARRLGHRVLAVVAGSAVNQDGASNGLTAPNGPSQQRVIRAALASAGLGPGDVDVVEGHGTGTRLGDPIEAQALLATYGQGRDEGRPLLLGSVKSNIGHTQAAAGVAGVIKMVAAIARGTVPPTLHVDAPSTRVDWDAGAVQVVTQSTPWPDAGRPRRAGVSSFGFSGTNAHVILEQSPASEDMSPAGVETPTGPPVADDGRPVVWVTSGRSAEGLAAQAGRVAAWAAGRPGLGAADVGWSLATTRPALEYRAAVVGASAGDLAAALDGLAADGDGPGLVRGVAGGAGKTAVVFTGQGAQRPGMGAGLYRAYPVFAETFDAVCAVLDGQLRRPDNRQPGPGGPGVRPRLADVVAGRSAGLDETCWTQAGLFAVEAALFALLRSWGITPDAVAGYSVGELAAAYAAGVWSLEDACTLVAARGRLMQALPAGGAMTAVAAPEEEVLEVLAAFPGVVVSAVNGPSSVVISGDATGVEQAAQHFAGQGVRTRVLRVSHAFHSPLMDPMLEEFAAVARSVAYREPGLAVVSALTGQPLTAGEVTDPGYWVRHVREPVRFAGAVGALRGAGVRTFIEAGPDGILSGIGPAAGDPEQDEAWLPVLRRDRDEARTAVTAVAGAWARGVTVDWAAVLGGGRRVSLPPRAFHHRRYWLLAAPAADAAGLGQEPAGHPLLGAAVELPASGSLVLTGRLSVRAQPWLADHVIAGRVLVPGTALAEMAMRAATAAGCAAVEELLIQAPLVLPARGGIAVQVMVGAAAEDGRREVSIYSRAHEGGPWGRHAAGTVTTNPAAQPDVGWEQQWPPAGAVPVDLEGFYPGLAQAGYEYGPAFRGLRAAWRRGEELFAEVALAEGTAPGGFAVHPAMLDSALHVLVAVAADSGGNVRVPFAFTGVSAHATGAAAARVRIAPAGSEAVSIMLADAAGQPVASVAELVLRPLPATTAAAAAEALFQVEWTPAPTGQREAGGQACGLVAVVGEDAGLAVPGAVSYPDVAALADAVRSGEAAAAGGQQAGLAVWCARPGDGNPAVAGRVLAARVLEVVQGWLAEPALAGWRLVIVTGRAVDAGPEAGVDPAAAPVWGLVRSAAAENPGRLVLGDVDVLAGSGELVIAGAGLGEPEFAVRGGQLRVPRLARARAGLAVPSAAGWRLAVGTAGTVEGLVLEEAAGGLARLGAGQVRVAVKAAGVNFRDVLNVLGMYPGDAGLPGLEGAGVVLETGPGVTGLEAGDMVMGLFSGAFGPVAVTDARLLARVPAGWSLVQAAGAPVVFLTAWHALVTLAGLQPGERLLVHAAAGGVGMAAVQLARHLGAEVFGTASPPKHPVLARLGLDESHRASSRTTSFEQEFRAATGGTGVDVVLDSLAGEFVDASLRLTVPGGRFIEMGKTDVRDPAQVQAASGVSYQAFDLLADAGPDQVAGMLAELGALFASGVLVPLPAACWDVRQAPEAFRFLAQARHAGKVVLTIPAPAREGSVLVTGASGSLGGLVAGHLAATGTQRLLLASRSGPAATGTAALAARLAGVGAAVQVSACDVADRRQLAGVIAGVPAETPLRGVVHAAGVLDDGVTGSLTAGRVDAVMRPKADGAWYLHELTTGMDLDSFVLFSSVAGVLGSAGQGNYAAGNMFLDALAAYRSRLGLPALSLAWGSWEQGMAGRLTEADRRRLAGQGIRPLADAEGLALLDAAVGAGRPALVPAGLDPAAWRGREGLLPLLSGLATLTTRRYALATAAAAGVAAAAGHGSLAARLAALPPAEQKTALRQVICTQAAAVLGMAALDEADAVRSFRELGFDSLTAVELRNRLAAVTGLRLPATLVFDYPTSDTLADFIEQELVGAPSEVAVVSEALAGLAKVESSLAEIIKDEAARDQVAARLRRVFSMLGAVGEQETGSVAEKIKQAGDDDMFDFIDNELGL